MVQSRWQLDTHENAYGSNYINKDFESGEDFSFMTTGREGLQTYSGQT